jgi:AcrR family transcriptional regulator
VAPSGAMGRPSKFDRDALLDAAIEIAANDGLAKLTLGAIADRTGAPTGSIYHRFASLELLAGEAWVRSVERFQSGFVALLSQPDTVEAAVSAARYTPAWARERFDEARLLLLHRREELGAKFPRELGDRIAALEAEGAASLRSFAKRHFGHTRRDAMDTALFALVDVPYGAVRRHLIAGEPPPARVDALIERTCRAILERPR